ncbi:MAG: hypothetical protein L3K06_08555 [Thermoplasmata archaeon]|nr:hypothetical protein [Thermoplasmata archaeon]
MALPSAPGPGPYDLTLSTPSFYILVAVLVIFVGMLWLLRQQHPRGRRAVEGFLEAAGVDIAFLVLSLALVVAIVAKDPHGNRTSVALYEVVLGGFWLTFAIPVVTVGSAVHHRSRGGTAWLLPSILVAALLFLVCFAYYYAIA